MAVGSCCIVMRRECHGLCCVYFAFLSSSSTVSDRVGRCVTLWPAGSAAACDWPSDEAERLTGKHRPRGRMLEERTEHACRFPST